MITNITESIKYIGVDDMDLDLFESQYSIPNGMSYNSYVIFDDKTAILDSVDNRKCDEWLNNVNVVLQGKTPDYLIVHHMEPDHIGSMLHLAEKYPTMQIVASMRAVQMMPQFFHEADFSSRIIVVKEGDTLSLGKHTLNFFMAPMVHWPEVMVSYEQSEKILFSADAFGKFGALSHQEEWDCEARRYYFNICGKYGHQVQTLLSKCSSLDIKIICPLHGPILTDNLSHYIDLYNTWSKYEPETKGVFIAHASIHGGTAHAANLLAKMLREKGEEKVVVTDLCRDDMAEAIEDAFRYDRIVVAASSYDANVFPPMHDFLHHLQLKNFQNRQVGIIENGSWAPCAGRIMRSILEQLKNIEIIEPMLTIRSRINPENMPTMKALVDALTK
ncbi:MAG: FprA family A-type flavoprotein [Paludibacteraceae bacterium]|nr:FprA family A-type flavoprotein [Paludibacteraceae bacterium]